MPDLVIFDCDGVLVDSEPIAVRTHVRVLGELGWPITEQEVIERFVGRSTSSINELIQARLGAGRTAEAECRFTRLNAEAVDAGLRAVDGITDALARISLPVCVASGGSHDKMRHTLGRTGLYEHFAGAHLQRRGGRLRQAGTRPVPARRRPDGREARPLRRG
jgi:beta-phosphoglucomutase-like phosphatase (HAD superfamily)